MGGIIILGDNMKKNKRNLLISVVLVLLLIVFIGVLVNYQRVEKRDNDSMKELILSQASLCETNPEESTIDCSRKDEYLSNIEKLTNIEHSVPEMMDTLFKENILIYFVIVFPIIICGLSVYNYQFILKKKASLENKNYKKTIKSNIKSSYSFAMIIPCFIVLVMIILSACFKGNYSVPEYFTNKGNYYLYFVVMAISALLTGLYYVNLAYIASYKYRNLLFNLVLSLVLFLAVEMLFPVIIEVFINQYLKISIPYRSFYTLELFKAATEQYSIYSVLIASIFYFLSSSLVVYLLYKNKQKYLTVNKKKLG